MTFQQPIYCGDTGQISATFRAASEPPGYTSAKGTAGHFLAGPTDTSGRFSLFRWDMSATSGGPSPHFHRTYDETFYIAAERPNLTEDEWAEVFARHDNVMLAES